MLDVSTGRLNFDCTTNHGKGGGGVESLNFRLNVQFHKISIPPWKATGNSKVGGGVGIIYSYSLHFFSPLLGLKKYYTTHKISAHIIC